MQSRSQQLQALLIGGIDMRSGVISIVESKVERRRKIGTIDESLIVKGIPTQMRQKKKTEVQTLDQEGPRKVSSPENTIERISFARESIVDYRGMGKRSIDETRVDLKQSRWP